MAVSGTSAFEGAPIIASRVGRKWSALLYRTEAGLKAKVTYTVRPGFSITSDPLDVIAGPTQESAMLNHVAHQWMGSQGFLQSEGA